MDLYVSNYAVLHIFGIDIWITETIVNTWLVIGILTMVGIVFRIAMRNPETVPKGLQNIAEIVVETFRNFVLSSVGPGLVFLAPWYFAIASLMLSSVFLSLLGFRSPTADWVTTFAMAFSTFFLMIAMGIKVKGWVGYFKTFLVPGWPFLPINVIGELAKPVSLSFRLFGNMLSGTIIIAIYNFITPWWASIGVPVLLHLIFDIFFGVLQTYIFVTISMSYVNDAANG